MTVVIELDSPAPRGGVDPGPNRRRDQPVVLAALMALAVIILLSGPGLLLPPSPARSFTLPTSIGFFWLTDGTLYTVDEGDDATTVVLTAREPDTGTPRWAVTLSGPIAEMYARGDSFLSSNFPPDATEGVRTNVVELRGGLPILAIPAAALPLVHFGTGVAVTIERDVAGPTQPAAQPRVRADGLEWGHLVTVRDLAGRVRAGRGLLTVVRGEQRYEGVDVSAFMAAASASATSTRAAGSGCPQTSASPAMAGVEPRC
jgi:hypothetical protein